MHANDNMNDRLRVEFEIIFSLRIVSFFPVYLIRTCGVEPDDDGIKVAA